MKSNKVVLIGLIILMVGFLSIGSIATTIGNWGNFSSGVKAPYMMVNGTPWIDVKAYGLSGNGVTDDTTALKNLMSSVPANTTIYFPCGRYYISDEINFTKTIIIKGDGLCSQIYQSADKNLFNFTDVHFNQVSNLYLGSAATTSTRSLINLQYSHRNIISNIYMKGGYYGIFVNGSLLNSIENPVFSPVNLNTVSQTFFGTTSTQQWAIYEQTSDAYATTPNANIIINPIIENGVNGIKINDAQTGSIIGGTIEQMTGEGLNISSSTYMVVSNLYEENNGLDVRLNAVARATFISPFFASTHSMNVTGAVSTQIALIEGKINELNVSSNYYIHNINTFVATRNVASGGSNQNYFRWDYTGFGNQTITPDANPSCQTMYSPDGTAYRFTIANGGATNVAAGTCVVS